MRIDSPHVHLDCRRVEDRLQTLLEATQRLSESIDYVQTLKNVVGFVAQRFASYALLDIVALDSRIERVAVAHSDPLRVHLVENIRRFHPRAEMVATHPVARAIVHGEVTLEAIDDHWIANAAIDPEHAETMRRLDMRELLIVPVLARTGDVLGALTCALDVHASRREFDADDVAFAQELGRRAGLAIENARLYEHERRIAVALQAASLPRVLPEIRGLLLDANYRPGSAEATIGGDWYDVIELDDGRVVFTIGDVVGSGLHAAVTMTKLRQAMQAAAMLRPEPTAMLEVAERTLRLHDPSGFATALAAVYDSRSSTITLASAGHPAPLLLQKNGEVEACELIFGLMLGVDPQAQREASTVEAAAGTSFVFYTDGLTEMTGDIEEGERRLRDVVAGNDVMYRRRPAREIVDAVLGLSIHTDDIAIMTCTIL